MSASDGDLEAQLVNPGANPGDIIIEPVLNDAEIFMDSIDPIAQDYGAALKTVRDVVRNALSDETILAAATPECPWLASVNREDQRRNTQTMRDIRSDIIHQTILAKNDAQVAEIGDRTEDREDAEAEAARQQELVTSGEGLAGFFAAVWTNVYQAERRKVQLEKQFLSETLDLVNAEPARLMQLLPVLTDPEADQEDQRPFLQFLAKNHFDPFEVSILDTVLENLEREHSLTFHQFVERLHECYDGDPAVREEARARYPEEMLEWFDLIARKTQQADGTLVLPGMLLGNVPLTAWPSSVRTIFLDEHNAIIKMVRQQYLDILSPLKDPSNFYISDDQLDEVRAANQARQSGGRSARAPKRKASSGGNRRVTQRTRATDFVISKVEDEPRAVNAIAEVAQTPNGYIHTSPVDLDNEPDDLEQCLLALEPVAAYLREKSSDPDIQRDLLAMMLSLLDQPRGNGSQKTTDIQLSFNVEGSNMNKKLPVWRLNPNQRGNLSVGDTARQTRIYFTIARSKEGKTTVGIVDVRHKASSESLRHLW